MKVHTNDLKNALRGMVVDNVKIIYGTTTLGTDEIIDVEFFYEGSLLKTMMKGLTITSTEDIAKDTIINFKYSIYIEKEPPATSGFEDLDFGNYVVVSSEKNEDSNTYTITCYDKLIYSAVDYVDLNLTYPITLGNYLSAICTHLGLTLSTSTFTNSTMEIPSELYLDIGYKFRDVLDEISQATGTSICLNASDKVELRVPTATNDTIDEDFISDLTTKFKEKYGPINTLVLSRGAESDNLYYPSTLPANPVEIKITDNQILNGEDREDYMAGIASNVFGIEFYQNDFTSPGIFYYDFLDKYNVSIDGTTYNCIMFNDDISIANKTEVIHSDIPQFSETDYSQASSTDRTINRALLTVNKATAEIDAKVSKDDIIADLNLAIVEGQGVINATGNTFILNADNASIDAEGNAEFNDAKLRGGNLVLEDDGTEENASIEILQNNVEDIIFLNFDIDLTDRKIYMDFRNMSFNELSNLDNTTILEYTTANNEEIVLKFRCYTQSNNEIIKLELSNQSNFFVKTYNEFVSQVWDITLPNNYYYTHMITNTILSKKFFLKSNVADRKTYYSGKGIDAKIFTKYSYSMYDISRSSDIAQGYITPTSEDYERYDLDNDGVISSADSSLIYTIFNNGISIETPAHFKIDYNDLVKILSLEMPSNSVHKDIAYIGLINSYFYKCIIDFAEIKNSLNVYGNIALNDGDIYLNNNDINLGNGEWLKEKITDSGWINSTTLETGVFKAYNNNNSNLPKYRKIGKTVQVQGIVSPISALTASSSYKIFTLPSGYRPSVGITKICQGTGANIWLLEINTAGEAYLSRYRNSSSYGSASANAWLPFDVMFFVD